MAIMELDCGALADQSQADRGTKEVVEGGSFVRGAKVLEPVGA